MVKAIPRSLLPHTVTYEDADTESSFDNAYLQPVTLEFVRVEHSQDVFKTQYNEKLKANALLFFDCVNSTPQGHVFKERAKITWNGQSYIVDRIDMLYTKNKLHHYEVRLV